MTLQSGFDGDELMSRPGIEVVPADGDVIRRAEKLIDGCEHCHEDDADIPFDWILDKVTGRSGATTDYILTESARCPLQAGDYGKDAGRADNRNSQRLQFGRL
jgi:hypothetical protein